MGITPWVFTLPRLLAHCSPVSGDYSPVAETAKTLARCSPVYGDYSTPFMRSNAYTNGCSPVSGDYSVVPF